MYELTVACSYEPSEAHSWGKYELLLLTQNVYSFCIHQQLNYPPFASTQLNFTSLATAYYNHEFSRHQDSTTQESGTEAARKATIYWQILQT